MWLTSLVPQAFGHPETQRFLNLCFYLSPDVFTDKVGTHVFLRFASPSPHLNSPHSNTEYLLHEQLRFLRHPYPFVLCPSPTLGKWVLSQEQAPSQILSVYNSLEIQKKFQQFKPDTLDVLLSDLFYKNKNAQKQWEIFIKDLRYFDVRNILELKALLRDPELKKQFFNQFPVILPTLYQRLILGTQDHFLLQPYLPQKTKGKASHENTTRPYSNSSFYEQSRRPFFCSQNSEVFPLKSFDDFFLFIKEKKFLSASSL
jgi:hypothetical protein